MGWVSFLSLLRAVVEVLLLCQLGQIVLFLLAGRKRSENAVFLMLATVTLLARRIVAAVLRRDLNGFAVMVGVLLASLGTWLSLGLAKYLLLLNRL